MMMWRLVQWPSQYCEIFGKMFLVIAFLGLTGQVVYDQHPITVVSLFPQWLLLGSIWHLWRQNASSQDDRRRGTLVLVLLIPVLSCLTLVIAWFGWKANLLAICGVIPISDA